MMIVLRERGDGERGRGEEASVCRGAEERGSGGEEEFG
jgi:hypothetical protein